VASQYDNKDSCSHLIQGYDSYYGRWFTVFDYRERDLNKAKGVVKVLKKALDRNDMEELERNSLSEFDDFRLKTVEHKTQRAAKRRQTAAVSPARGKKRGKSKKDAKKGKKGK
jgi:hypothetical protein